MLATLARVSLRYLYEWTLAALMRGPGLELLAMRRAWEMADADEDQ